MGGVGEKFVTKAQFEQWARLLEHRLYEIKAGAGGESESLPSFISLPDAPNSYSGQAGRPVKCNESEDGLEFGGSMLTDAVCDEGNVVVDDGEIVFDLNP